ncbi:hypothetical protein CIG15_17920 [Aeromonas veronii]|uniref:Uncharacterized protein n=1 Tax=Aeromonas veronii TaxID=654 RepID=A0ABY3MJL3_AERVE|nr:hypothetical protein CHF44_18430 [Aeromonas veronii]RDU82099.1 hypothetical protein CGZ76_16935 [Aeromonas veronii]TEY47705.1 hypothetical protein CIG14_17465 [Aeromonas veronii]TEY60828.1 hypothetical protein CIG15_17920 [Aeromonas veronii]TEY74840.1 hypothetical protein CIG16_17225 [Aeromonas veronii]
MVLLVDAEMSRYEPVSRVARKGLVIHECGFYWDWYYLLLLLIKVIRSDLDNVLSTVCSLFPHRSG